MLHLGKHSTGNEGFDPFVALDPVMMLGLLGVLCARKGQRLQTAVRWGAAGLLLERPEILVEWQRQEAWKQAICSLREQSKKMLLEEAGRQGQAVSPPTLKDPVRDEPDAEWRDVIVPPSVVLVLGKRGSGKSSLGYRLLELLRYALEPYVVGLPKEGEKLLPDWIGLAGDIDEVPTKSVVLLDEACLRYHSRDSLTARNKEMSRVLNLSRQRQQTLIFVSQEARLVDRGIASAANVVVFKDLGMLQPSFDRRELAKIASQAKEALAMVKGDRRRWSYVFSPDVNFAGLLENEPPSFWTSRLSCLYASASSPAGFRVSARLTPAQKAEKAKEMRTGGASYQAIARVLGVTRTTVLNYIRDYPYRQHS